MESPPRSIVLAIGGGIAAYKAADVCSKLTQAGYPVDVILTPAAERFLGVATLAALSGSPVATSLFDARYPLGTHIELAKRCRLLLVAPATADLLAKFAHGHADCLVSTLFLQNTSPVLLAPAMSDPMWNHPAVRRNATQLAEDGCHFVGPESGWLSCRVQGIGRMSEPPAIVNAVSGILKGIA